MLMGFFALLMVVSVVIGLFGMFRLIVGLLSRKKQVAPSEMTLPSEDFWPPAPKPLK